MKKLLCTLAVTALVTLFASAADVGTIVSDYPGDTEAQAQMLHELGLFNGTEKGFELEKPMTRAEAAAMLTRFLGAEQTALAGEWRHPFTDVPRWADKYVGWLYESGLTKGVSATRYGAEQPASCKQYCVLLSRAASQGRVDDGWRAEIKEKDVAACDYAGFVRGDAVALSAKMLGWHYWSDNEDISVAMSMVQKGVFTREQLKEAAWNVLPRSYGRTIEGRNWHLSCVIARVPVVVDEQSMVDVIQSAFPLNHVYGYTSQTETGWPEQLYLIDEQTLAQTQIATFSEQPGLDGIGKVGATDYLRIGDIVVAVTDGEVRQLDTSVKMKSAEASGEGERYVLAVDDGILLIDKDGARKVAVGADETLFALQGGLLITQNVTNEQTTVTAWTLDGEKTDQYTMVNDAPLEDDRKNSVDVVRLYAPHLEHRRDGLVWGGAGLYRVEDGHLIRLTARPVVDVVQAVEKDSWVAITREAGKRITYTLSAATYNAGDEVVRIHPDGREELILPDIPAHGLQFSEVLYAVGDEIHVIHTYVMGHSDQWIFEYAIENGKLRAIAHEPGKGFSGYDAEELPKEQKRLDELGVGIGA